MVISRDLANNLVILIVSAIFSLLIAEILIRQFTPFPITTTSNQVSHDELLYVMNSGLAEIDQFGFRNKTDPEHAKVFAIGDSHTYGFNVKSDQSWPGQLQNMANVITYNFGVGSYNIYQYFRLFEMAAQYRPRYVIIGFYPANDLAMNVCGVLELEHWRSKIVEHSLENVHCTKNSADQKNRTDKERGQNESRPIVHRIKKFLKLNVALISAIDNLVWDPIQASFDGIDEGRTESLAAEDEPKDSFRIITSSVKLEVDKKFVMTHSRSTDLGSPVVREHYSNSLTLFKRMKKESESQGIELRVLMIPSKGRVVVEWARANNVDIPALFEQAVENEGAIFHAYRRFFDTHSILASDVTHRMAELMEKDQSVGIQTYLPGDGHPLAPGYGEYAKSASEMLTGKSVR